jgi:hypothetical protein
MYKFILNWIASSQIRVEPGYLKINRMHWLEVLAGTIAVFVMSSLVFSLLFAQSLSYGIYFILALLIICFVVAIAFGFSFNSSIEVMNGEISYGFWKFRKRCKLEDIEDIYIQGDPAKIPETYNVKCQTKDQRLIFQIGAEDFTQTKLELLSQYTNISIVGAELITLRKKPEMVIKIWYRWGKKRLSKIRSLRHSKKLA